jgi:hypothetical protein
MTLINVECQAALTAWPADFPACCSFPLFTEKTGKNGKAVNAGLYSLTYKAQLADSGSSFLTAACPFPSLTR